MKSAEEILDFAIGQEIEAIGFYAGLAEHASKPWMKEILLEFSREEERHRDRLLEVKNGTTGLSSQEGVLDLKVSDYLVEVEANPEMSYQDSLILAMKREKAAYRMYMDLAAKVDDESLRELFLGLAQEEAKHKLYFEVEYDERILQDN